MYHTCPILSSISSVNHGFFTRNGGVSDGIYDSLNCGYGSGDDAGKVAVNRSIVADTVGAKTLCTVHQTHSADCVIVENAWDYKDAPQADAMVTNKAGIALGILTADCLPILFCDPQNGVIGAAHSGWKGSLGGISEATIEKMLELGADKQHIVATIGPAISQKAYEVGVEFYQRFIEQNPENKIFFIDSKQADHYMFDLPNYAKNRLSNAGISQINMIAQDTYFNDNEFFSFRRTTKRGEPAYGRQISVIMLK